MHLVIRMLAITAATCLIVVSLSAQDSVDPSGHWEGFIQAPDRQVAVEIDVARNSSGHLVGTFTQPGDAAKGLPFASVTVEDRTLRLVLRLNSGGGTFKATLSADGKTLDGDFTMAEGGYVLPFTLKHTGEPRIAPPPKSAPIGKEFEGAWKGALDLNGKPMRILLTLTNHADGTATGTVASPDGTGIEIPVAMTQTGTMLKVDVPSVSASFAGVLSADGITIAGTWTQAGSSLPLTLRR